MFQHAPEKVRSHLAQLVRELAEEKGRSAALAEAMVDMDLEVFQCENKNTGEIAYLSEAELESRDDAGSWEKGNLVIESKQEHFLELSGERAVELGMADSNSQSRNELKLRYNASELVVFEPQTIDTVVFVLNHPISTVFAFYYWIGRPVCRIRVTRDWCRRPHVDCLFFAVLLESLSGWHG